MKIFCTRPGCTNPHNSFADLDDQDKLRTVQQRYCKTCGMPLLLADRYIPAKLLGQGGFGAAFLARDRYRPKMPLCVVKLFQPSASLDAQELAIAQKLFQREAVALEELGQKHLQIPDLYAFFTPIVSNSSRTGEEQYFYLAQEYIDGQDLESELKTKGRYTEAEVVEILTEILKVLQFVHDNNTIHRDIKPSNIMRAKDGTLYLLDFGAVKQIAAAGGNHKKSTGIYSMGFAPPEQMSGSQVYPATDIYALAVTSITFLTGQPTEELYDSFKYAWNWQGYAPNTSDRLVDVLNKMLLPTPAERFQSAQSALAALEALTAPTQLINTIQVNPPASTVSAPAIPSNLAVPAPTQGTTSQKIKKQSRPSRSRFSLTEILGSAAFTGFEGALFYLGLTSALSVSGISLGIFGVLMGGLVFALSRRIIEKVDLVILAIISTAVISFIPLLQGTLGVQSILIVAAMSAAGALGVTAFFRLIYQLLSRF